MKVRSRAEDPQGFDRLRPCCDSTAGVAWSLQSYAGALLRSWLRIRSRPSLPLAV